VEESNGVWQLANGEALLAELIVTGGEFPWLNGRLQPCWGATRPCLRIVRAVCAALTDGAGVIAHRPGALEHAGLAMPTGMTPGNSWPKPRPGWSRC
jgi:hypothetical protein